MALRGAFFHVVVIMSPLIDTSNIYQTTFVTWQASEQEDNTQRSSEYRLPVLRHLKRLLYWLIIGSIMLQRLCSMRRASVCDSIGYLV